MIRPAGAADAAAIAAIWNHYIRHTLATFNAAEKTDDEVAAVIGARTASGHCFLVAMDGEECLGFATYGQFRNGVGYARTMEHTILLAPAATGRGVGRALMQAVEVHARDAGAHSIFAGVSGGNPEGRAFHLRLGYREVCVLPEVGFKFGRYFDLHLMQKHL